MDRGEHEEGCRGLISWEYTSLDTLDIRELCMKYLELYPFLFESKPILILNSGMGDCTRFPHDFVLASNTLFPLLPDTRYFPAATA